MTDKHIQRSDQDVLTYVKRIATGVMIILWIVLTSALTWPLATIIDAYRDGDWSNTSVGIGFVIAAIVSTVICRLVFPIDYETTNTDAQGS